MKAALTYSLMCLCGVCYVLGDGAFQIYGQTAYLTRSVKICPKITIAVQWLLVLIQKIYEYFSTTEIEGKSERIKEKRLIKIKQETELNRIRKTKRQDKSCHL